MANTKKLIQAAAGSAGGAGGLNIEEVFSTYLYEGNGSTQTITNDIDLSGEGGLVWMKARSTAESNILQDTDGTGVGNVLSTNSTSQMISVSGTHLSAFNSNGFSIGTSTDVNRSGTTMASWAFRKAPKFFDVVTYTGNGGTQNISHNLGAVPGCVIFKRTDSSTDWLVWHKNVNGTDADGSIRLNTTAAKANGQPWDWDGVTDTYFPLISDWTEVNASGGSYVAYFFAHNDGDGGFGPDGDADIIKCGSYSGDSTTDGSHEINLGFEPQWVLIKQSNGSDLWFILDTMRGMTDSSGSGLYPHSSAAEDTNASVFKIQPTPTGFRFFNNSGFYNLSGEDYIYIAIRRGPMAVPESATDVFAVDNGNSSDSDPTFISNFPVDMAIRKLTTGSSGFISSRLTWQLLNTDNTNAEGTGSTLAFDNMDGYEDFAAASTQYSWMWRRAPSYFDAVTYTGNGTAGRTVSHNLGVAPEMMWVKQRNASNNWYVYHSGLNVDGDNAPETDYMYLDDTGAAADGLLWYDTAPTATDFTLFQGSAVNGSGNTYIAYLFASLAGVSKVGSYTGTGATQNIDCGFSSGARFVLIKKTSATGGWMVFDTERGIVAGNDFRLELDDTGAESNTSDWIDPYSAGFSLPSTSTGNTSGATYIFYAIA